MSDIKDAAERTVWNYRLHFFSRSFESHNEQELINVIIAFDPNNAYAYTDEKLFAVVDEVRSLLSSN